MSGPTKSVKLVEEAEFKGSDEVYVNTRDGWCYVFQRPNEHEPYQLKQKRRPDGSISENRTRTPEPVVEYMEERYDSANLHPDFRRDENRKW